MYNAPAPLLLSRVADAAYWAGRYLERAEGTARLVRAHNDLLLDLPAAADVGWMPLLAVVGDETSINRGSEDWVIRELTADPDNSSSIVHSMEAVHHNLRVTRAVMPIEAAEVLTELHNEVSSTATAALHRRNRQAWLTRVIRGCQTLAGILSETMVHDDAFRFFTIGRELERADMTTRVLDVQAEVLTGQAGFAVEMYGHVCTAAALRSVSALQAFRRRGQASTGEAAVRFLLLDPLCPRTVQFCLTDVSRWLLEIPRHEDPMSACSAMQVLLDSVDIAEMVEGGWLHDFVDRLQLAIGAVHEQIHDTWFAPTPVAAGAAQPA